MEVDVAQYKKGVYWTLMVPGGEIGETLLYTNPRSLVNL
jgi:hypothetical protein